jgi:tetratricopeptide (TPR) repeat protein
VEAQVLRDSAKAQAAVSVLENCLRDNPEDDHPLLRFHLGTALLEAERYADAIGQFQEVTRLDPSYAEAWLNLGRAAFAAGRYQLAAEGFRRGYEESPAPLPEALYYAGTAHYLAGEPGAAAEILEDLIHANQQKPRKEWYRLLLHTCLQLERDDLAADAQAGLIKHFSADPEAWHMLHEYAAGSGDYRRAALALTVADYLKPLNRDQLLRAGDLYLAIGVPIKACAFYERALADSASVAESERWVSAQMAAHDWPQAQQVLTQALGRSPAAGLWSLQGDLSYMKQDYAASYEAYRECARHDSTRGRPHLMMARCALQLGREQEALRHLAIARDFPAQARSAEELRRQIQSSDR